MPTPPTSPTTSPPMEDISFKDSPAIEPTDPAKSSDAEPSQSTPPSPKENAAEQPTEPKETPDQVQSSNGTAKNGLLENGAKEETPEDSTVPDATPAPSSTAPKHPYGSKTTISALLKLLDEVPTKKISLAQKTLMEACKEVLKDGRIPSTDLVDLLKALENNLALKGAVVDALLKIFSFENNSGAFNEIQYAGYTQFLELCLDTLSNVFRDETDDAVELQIVKTVVSIVMNEHVEVHGGKLLEGIRLIYNIFILTVSQNTQMIAEANLTQIIDYYFQRVGSEAVASSSTVDLVENNTDKNNLPALLNALETLNLDDERKFSDMERSPGLALLRDCFLIFRAMSKLLLKPVDGFLDPRLAAVRLKMLLLRTIYLILKNHIGVFLDKKIRVQTAENTQVPFILLIRNYLLLALTKNAVYQLENIYQVCLDIFYVILTNLRADFLGEIPVIFSDVFFPLVDMPLLTGFQKEYFLQIIGKLANDPRLLIELYLNFDCLEHQPNVVEQIIGFLVRTENANMKSAEKGEEYSTTALEEIVSVLRSLCGWASKGEEVKLKSPVTEQYSLPNESSSEAGPSEFEHAKRRKTLLLECCRSFNYKPKKGIAKLIEHGFIPSEDPKDVANFLLNNSGNVNKEVLGEYLGEGDEYNIKVMHAFTDLFDFKNMKFVDAMRMYLQSFRLPGESQKIDRFMLKFAETYYKLHPGGIFLLADTLYIFSYLVIMLNTDQHNGHVKSRMSVEDFIKNNQGIDDGKDLPRQVLEDVYKDIATNEIILELEHSVILGRSKSTENQYLEAAREISLKTEKALNLRNFTRQTRYFQANHNEHVKLIFDTLWMLFLAALTPSFRAFDSPQATALCLEGLKLSIRITCHFLLSDARTAFVNALIQFTNLGNISEMKQKNAAAVEALLSVCSTEGNGLGSSWLEILIAVLRLERLLLIAQGADASSVPDVLAGRNVHAPTEPRVSDSSLGSRFFARPSQTEIAQANHLNQKLTPEMALFVALTELSVRIDKIFAGTANMPGDAITCFVRALAAVAQDEVQLLGLSPQPRVYLLQKMVDVCYYNMGRIRVEWAKLWAEMAPVFNSAGSSLNAAVALLALDLLRQLSMRFLEIEELEHFSFQREFLRPFAYVMARADEQTQLMALECVENMIAARAERIRSGWSTILELLAAAGTAESGVAERAYEVLSGLTAAHYNEVCTQGAFQGLVDAYTLLACNERNQRISLHLIADMRKLVERAAAKQDMGFVKVLRGFTKVILENPDLESRLELLEHLFLLLSQHGAQFDEAAWKKVCDDLLFPIFGILSEKWGLDDGHDDLSVWLLTTLIQALKNMVAIFKRFSALNPMLDGYLDLLTLCVLLENDTILRIGRSCLQDLIVDNCARFGDTEWRKITQTVDKLFMETTATELFSSDPLAQADGKELKEAALPTSLRSLNRSIKGAIVVKSVLQLLMIESVSELFSQREFYEKVPVSSLLDMMECLKRSHKFASDFNENYDLRVRLWNLGVLERLPNLLKQESLAAGVYIGIAFRLLMGDKLNEEEHSKLVGEVMPLCISVLREFVKFDETTKQRQVNTWRPVVVAILQGYCALGEDDFILFCPTIYELVLSVLEQNMGEDLGSAVRGFLGRVGEVYVRM